MWFKLFADDPAGGYPQKSLEDARREAERLWALKSAGKDPRLEHERSLEAERERVRREAEEAAELARQQLTVRQLFKRWKEADLAHVVIDGEKRRGRKDGGALVELQFEKHVLPSIGERQAVGIRRADLMEVLDKIKQAGLNRTANTILSHLRQMFTFAIVRELVERDPTAGISKRRDAGGRDAERERTLSDEEIKALAAAMPAARLPKHTQLAVWIMLSTICRVGELMQAQWGDLDLEDGVWNIPGRTTKNGRDHLVHLSPFAVAQFSELLELKEHKDFVFPGRGGEACLDQKTVNKQLRDRQMQPSGRAPMKGRSKQVGALALPGGTWTPHDLRRTGATLMSRLGISTEIIHLCQNHTLQDQLARIYIRDGRLAERRGAFDALGRKLEELIEVRQTGQVLEFRVA